MPTPQDPKTSQDQTEDSPSQPDCAHRKLEYRPCCDVVRCKGCGEQWYRPVEFTEEAMEEIDARELEAFERETRKRETVH